MKPIRLFTIQNLLYNTEDLKGPILQVLFAKKMADYEGAFSYNRLARVTFEDTRIHTAVPGGPPVDETLLMGVSQTGYSTLHLVIRAKQAACRVATGYFPHREVMLHEQYQHALFMDKLTEPEILHIFNHVWDHPEILQPSGFPVPDLL